MNIDERLEGICSDNYFLCEDESVIHATTGLKPAIKQLIRDVIKEATPERQEEYPDDGETTHYNGHYADPYNDVIDQLEANVKRLGL